jgi:hypothetical protein
MIRLIEFTARLVGPRFAAPLVYGALILFAALSLWGLKPCYDSSVIENARQADNAEALRLKARADEKAAQTRGRDQARAQTEAEQLKETVDEAVEQGRDPRAAYYECIRMQQSARAANRATPAC